MNPISPDFVLAVRQLLYGATLHRDAYFDRARGTIGYGSRYGEFSYNGQPLYHGPLEEFLGPVRMVSGDEGWDILLDKYRKSLPLWKPRRKPRP